MKLYKFCSLKKYNRIFDILSTGKFYLSDWKKLNDPMEGLFRYIAEGENSNLPENVRNFILTKNELKICSFSNTYKSILLWSHYANYHKGIAIQTTLNSKHYSELKRVNYVKNIPTLDFNNAEKIPNTVLTKKIHFWKYEREFRMISKNQKEKIGKITGIVLGIRTEREQIDRLKNDFPDIPLYETKLDTNKNRIEIK